MFLYLSEPGVGSDTPRISTNCTELWLLVVTNQSPLFQFEDSFCFRTPVWLLQKSVLALRFSYGNSWFEKPPWIRQWIRHEENLPILSMGHPGCLMTGSFFHGLLMFIVLDQQNKNTPIRQQKKSSVHCGDSGWWSIPIFSGPGGVFVARNIMLNSQLSSKFVQFFGKHDWLHKIHSKFQKKHVTTKIHNPLFCKCLNLEWIFCVANLWFFQTHHPSMFHSSLLC